MWKLCFHKVAGAEQAQMITSLSVSACLCLAPAGMKPLPGLTSLAPACSAFPWVSCALGTSLLTRQPPCPALTPFSLWLHV